MTTRQARPSDLPAVIDLLKLSLGESLMPKSEAFWNWKHIENPFGPSPVLLAFENEVLIGVRAFMRWEWTSAEKRYRAVRAVDTATHPDYQGKGVFKKLTLSLVEQCKQEGVDFVFNTPNKSSAPGYLKMGWSANGKLPISIEPVLSFKTADRDFDLKYEISAARLNYFIAQEGKIETARSIDYLDWRYIKNPNVKYYCCLEPEFCLVFRLKKSKVGTELRVCELFMHPGSNSRNAWKKIRKIGREAGARFISNALQGGSFWPSLPIGPLVTVRSLSSDTSILTWNNWKLSLGDLEVF